MGRKKKGGNGEGLNVWLALRSMRKEDETFLLRMVGRGKGIPEVLRGEREDLMETFGKVI